MSELTTVFIVDDEERAIKSIKKHVELRDDLLLKGYALDPMEALEMIPTLEVKVVFIDMKMEGMSGLEFIKALGPEYTYICCSAYGDYGSKLSLLDVPYYLLKPIVPEEFDRTIDLCIRNRKVRDEGVKAIEVERLLKEGRLFIKLRCKNESLYIPYEDIEVLIGHSNETLIQCKDVSYLAAGSLGDFEKQLPKALFMKTHRSFIIAKRVAKSIKGGKKVGLESKNAIQLVKLSKSYKKDVAEVLELNIINNDKSNKSSA